MRRWELRNGATVFSEGSHGGNCFVILQGTIDVSVNTRGQQQLVAILEPGSVFGQMSLIEGVPRSATCSVRVDAVLLEILRAPCEKLLNSGSTLALKFLATLNEGLILALRGADLRLMQLGRNEARTNL
jgi:CRP-like cAMP-binding protein